MTPRTTRIALAILALATVPLLSAATPAGAQGVFVSPGLEAPGRPLTGLRARVARELPRYGYRDVDVRRLSVGQLAHISSLIHSDRSFGDVKGHIGAALRRGLLQRGLDRVTRRRP